MPDYYTLSNMLSSALEELGHEVYFLDYREEFNSFVDKKMRQFSNLHKSLRKRLEASIIKRSNEFYLRKIEEIKPDLVLIYNSEMINVETIKKIKQQNIKIAFYLGDNPLYTFTNSNNLSILFHSDLTICPDSFWLQQLSDIGVMNLIHHYLGYDKSQNYVINEDKVYSSDLMFIGRSHPNSWGYKRMLFLDQFNELDMKIYANSNSWDYWINDFPKLKDKITLLSGRISHEEVNKLCNATKIYPVDSNPGLINGVHLRVFECIGSGILPIIEYKKDLDLIFKGIELPVIKQYGEGAELAKYYLENEDKRLSKIKELQAYVNENYDTKTKVNEILEKLERV
jgi:spore maturation protein CgeB